MYVVHVPYMYGRERPHTALVTPYFSWVSWRTDWQCWLLYPL